MSVEISFGGVCRNVDLLPQDEAEFREFFTASLAPAIYQDFRKTCLLAWGQGADFTRDFAPELDTRECEIHGGVSIKF